MTGTLWIGPRDRIRLAVSTHCVSGLSRPKSSTRCALRIRLIWSFQMAAGVLGRDSFYFLMARKNGQIMSSKVPLRSSCFGRRVLSFYFQMDSDSLSLLILYLHLKAWEPLISAWPLLNMCSLPPHCHFCNSERWLVCSRSWGSHEAFRDPEEFLVHSLNHILINCTMWPSHWPFFFCDT